MTERRLSAREEHLETRNLLALDVASRTGISEALIARLVETFYGRVRQDDLLGPIFARVRDWDDHLARLRDFWSSVVLSTGRYRGQPMRVHLPLTLDGDHFDRWLNLFETAAREVCPPPAAAYFIEKARRIADSFEMAVGTQAGRMVAPRHVFRS